MEDMLLREKTYLRSHQAELSKEHPGKYLLIKGECVHGAFETFDEGVVEGVSLFGPGPFLVRSVMNPGDSEPPSIPALSLGVPFVAGI